MKFTVDYKFDSFTSNSIGRNAWRPILESFVIYAKFIQQKQADWFWFDDKKIMVLQRGQWFRAKW